MIVVEDRDLVAYETVPISFTVTSRWNPSGEVTVDPWIKDYDVFEDERPTSLSRRFDISTWLVLAAFEGQERLGGAIVAPELLGPGIACLVDLRVHPSARQCGVGRTLLVAAAEWSISQGCLELAVETQDVNAPACKFYASLGFELRSIEPQGYGHELDEAKLMWHLDLRGT